MEPTEETCTRIGAKNCVFAARTNLSLSLWLALCCAAIGFFTVEQTVAAGLGQRQANNTLRFGSKPPTYPYELVPAFNNVEFKNPVSIATAPNETHRIFVVEQGGEVVAVNLASPSRSVFLDISDRVAYGDPDGEGGTLGIAFHPRYATNGHVFVYYLCNASTPGVGNGRHNRLSRFTRSRNDPNKIDASSEVILFSQYDEEFNHNGGSLAFGPDGYLYVTLGDEGYPDDIFDNGQRIDKDFFGGVLRIDVDKRALNLQPNPHPSLGGKVNYSIPRDNPYVGATSFNGQPVDSAKVRTEFWAVGLRSPWRMYMDTPTGNIYVSDVGEIGRIDNRSEEINLIVAGGNYGWPYYESEAPGPKAEQKPAGFSSLPPLITYDRGNFGPYVGRAAIGGIVYRGTRFPNFVGAYIFGDYFTGNIWMLRHAGYAVQQWDFLMAEGFGHIVSFAADPSNGDVLVCDVEDDTVKRLVAISGNNMAPARLSDTGAFANMGTLEPNPGIVPYDINTPFWSDGALKRRWFSVPNVNDKMTFNGSGPWSFPVGTVWIKHFDLEMEKGNPATARRVETRFIVKDEEGIYGLTYAWDDSQANATLVPGQGADRQYTVNDGGAIRQQTWHFPARQECNSCHTDVAGYALGFNTPQLNRDYQYGGGSQNQITALAQAGYFNNAAKPGSRAMADISDQRASLETRVKSYLAANCANCHQPGGSSRAPWDARFSTSLSRAKIVNGKLNNELGDPNNRVVVPRSPDNSVLLQRMMTLENGLRMPPLSSSVVDEEGVALMREWIESLSGGGGGSGKRQPLRVRITAPKTSRAEQTVTITGTATGVDVARIVYSLNGGDEIDASGTTEWSADLSLDPGINRVLVYAIDSSGNRSRPAKKKFKYVPLQ